MSGRISDSPKLSVATTTETFYVPGSKSLSAVSTPVGTLYTSSTGTFTETVSW